MFSASQVEPFPGVQHSQIAAHRYLPQPSFEQWRDVPGFEDEYVVSSLGRICRKPTGHVLKPWIAAGGYCYVDLRGECRKRKIGVHVIVAEAFHGPRPSPGHEVAHWDGVTTNNTVDNLRWATHRENLEDRRRHGTLRTPVFQGASHPGAKLTDHDVFHIRSIYSGRRGELSDLAELYRVHRTTIKRAASGETWVHL